MYEKFYGLKEKPFNITPDPRFLYFSDTHKEALAYLRYAIKERAGFSVITGEVGTGKTTLVHALLNEVDGAVQTAYIFNPVMGREDFLNYICEDLGLKTAGVRSHGQNLAALHNFLLGCYVENKRVFLIIDEAQSLDTKLLEEVRLLTNLETSTNKLLHVILLGQPELNRILSDEQFRALKQRVIIRFNLRTLNLTETKEYILYRLKKAGARNLSVFNESAIKEIYKYSKGIPRVINIVCDNALVTGYSQDQNRIGKPIIEEVIKDLEGPSMAKKKKVIPTLLLIAILLLCVLFVVSLFFINPGRIWNYLRIFSAK